MPIVTISGPRIDVDQKRRLADGMTKVACEVYGRPAEQIIVIIRENPPENVAIAGKLVADQS